MKAITITKRNGTRVPLNIDKIHKMVEEAVEGIYDRIGNGINTLQEHDRRHTEAAR